MSRRAPHPLEHRSAPCVKVPPGESTSDRRAGDDEFARAPRASRRGATGARAARATAERRRRGGRWRASAQASQRAVWPKRIFLASSVSVVCGADGLAQRRRRAPWPGRARIALEPALQVREVLELLALRLVRARSTGSRRCRRSSSPPRRRMRRSARRLSSTPYSRLVSFT